MDALRLNDVVVRVVAWHNRHPLARRITADQVHSIGEVVLPFRSRNAVSDGMGGPTAVPPAQDPAFEPTANAPGQTLELAEAPEPPEAPEAPGAPEAPAPVVPAWAAPEATPMPSACDRLRQVFRAALARLPRLARRGPRIAPAFSEKFIWPMTPAAVARWAERHAALTTIAPEDWPRRVVNTDGLLAHRLEAQGLTVALELHLLSAAIGVGDRRIRLLLDARHSIVGPRSYSPPRLTGIGSALGGLVLATLFGSGALHLPTLDSVRLALPSTPAPAVVTAAVLPALPEHSPDSSAAPVKEEVAAASATAASGAAMPTEAAAPIPVTGHASADPHADSESPQPVTAPTEHSAEVAVSAPPAASAPAVAAMAVANVNPADAVASAAGRIALTLRPHLSQDERDAARESGQQLRSQSASADLVAAAASPPARAVAAEGPVYALVTAPTRLRDESLIQLTRVRSLSGLDGALKSARSDLISAQGLWQAALWPFGSRADAERARAKLASKGLKAQVVEF